MTKPTKQMTIEVFNASGGKYGCQAFTTPARSPSTEPQVVMVFGIDCDWPKAAISLAEDWVKAHGYTVCARRICRDADDSLIEKRSQTQ